MLGLDQGLIKGQRGLVAWVNFNGTGTVAIRASYNVSSITDNGTGNYTVNFAAALPNINYFLAGYCAYDFDSILAYRIFSGTARTTSSAQIRTGYVSSVEAAFTADDVADINIGIFC